MLQNAVFMERTKKLFSYGFSLPILSPQTALFGFLDYSESEDFLLFNHIFLVFKLYLYKAREEKNLHLKLLLMNIADVKTIEKKLATTEKKIERFKKKWQKTDQKLSI